MQLIYSKDYDLLQSVLMNADLLKVIGYEGNLNNFKIDRGFEYLIIEDNAKLLGCFQLRKITNLLYEVHINIRPEYWGKGDFGFKACQELFNWVCLNTKQRIIITDVPAECKIIHKLMCRLNATVCGLIKNGVHYNKTTQDLLLYNIDLTGIN